MYADFDRLFLRMARMFVFRPVFVLIGLLALLLAGCGQKGPLYLPKPSAAQAILAPFHSGL